MARVEAKQAGEEKALDKVRDTIASKVDEKEYKPNLSKKGGFEDPDAKKPDLSEFKKALGAIEKDNEEKEAKVEARKEMIASFPANPIVAASEAAEEEHEKKKLMEQAANFAVQEKAQADFEKMMNDKNKKKAATNAEVKKGPHTDEQWVANMPGHLLEGYIQTQVQDIKRQLAQVEAEDSDSDSSSGSDSDSD